MLGISSYFQDLDYEYLKRASEIGARFLFTSLHIPEEDLSHLPKTLPVFLSKCKEYNLDLVPDISPLTLEKLGIKNNNFKQLKEMGFKVLRLDFGFDDFETVNLLLEDFDLMLNASVVDEKYILEGIEAGVDFSRVSMLHNFYPKQETGLSFEYFDGLNQVFRKYNLPISAFVPGDLIKRYPMYEGLPTIERHRSINPYVAGVQLITQFGVRDIYIGDSSAKFETLQYIQDFMDKGILHVPVILESQYKEMFSEDFSVRKDLSETIVRLVTPRVENVPVFNNIKRPKGALTIDNLLAKRYSGEIQITKKDLPMDARVNVVGYIHPEFVELVDYIGRDTLVRFVLV